MGRKKMGISVLLCVFLVCHFCNVSSSKLSEVEDKKNNFSPDPNAWSSPRNSHNIPNCQTPPTPSHGLGINYPPPPSPFHGGGGSSGGHGSSNGGGGRPGNCNCNSPPSHTPSPLLPQNPPSSTTPISQSPPSITNPSPPYIPDPNSPPFPCSYWFSHPTAIWVLFGYWGTIGEVFGATPATGFLGGRNLSLMQALGNTREDGYGALLREGTAALLNSMASKSFYFSSQEVREGFNAAVRSEKMAAAQSKIFQKANEGHLKKF